MHDLGLSPSTGCKDPILWNNGPPEVSIASILLFCTLLCHTCWAVSELIAIPLLNVRASLQKRTVLMDQERCTAHPTVVSSGNLISHPQFLCSSTDPQNVWALVHWDFSDQQIHLGFLIKILNLCRIHTLDIHLTKIMMPCFISLSTIIHNTDPSFIFDELYRWEWPRYLKFPFLHY
jgi:hypothetical protein